MQFSKDLAEKIMAESKEQTRRAVKDGERAEVHPVRGVITKVFGGGLKLRKKWSVGQAYAVQPGRGKPAIGRIQITGIHMEHVQHIAGADARKEGFASVAEFRAKWEELYPKGPYAWKQNPLVWVLDFEVVKDGQ